LRAYAGAEFGQEKVLEKKEDFFFEKRSKKLLPVASASRFRRSTPVQHRNSKSFLVLFFKKEHSSFFALQVQAAL
jgi:hypothetical protein